MLVLWCYHRFVHIVFAIVCTVGIFTVETFAQQTMNVTVLSDAPIVNEASGRSVLVVRSNISGISISSNRSVIDNRTIGNNVYHFILEEGQHQISFFAPGFLPVQNMRFSMPGGSSVTVEVVNTNETGSIQVTSTPSGATVRIDGRTGTYNTPCEIRNLPPGTYTLNFSKSGYSSRHKVVTVYSGRRSNASMTLSLQSGHESFRRTSNRKPYWEDVEFFFSSCLTYGSVPVKTNGNDWNNGQITTDNIQCIGSELWINLKPSRRSIGFGFGLDINVLPIDQGPEDLVAASVLWGIRGTYYYNRIQLYSSFLFGIIDGGVGDSFGCSFDFGTDLFLLRSELESLIFHMGIRLQVGYAAFPVLEYEDDSSDDLGYDNPTFEVNGLLVRCGLVFKWTDKE